METVQNNYITLHRPKVKIKKDQAYKHYYTIQRFPLWSHSGRTSFIAVSTIAISNQSFLHITFPLLLACIYPSLSTLPSSNYVLTLSLQGCHYLFSLLSAMSCLFKEFVGESTNHALNDIFLHSHYLSAWYCIDIVGRNSVLVTCGN